MNWTKEKMQTRLIRYQDLVPCKNAFVDSRNPGSDQKENFTLIGPGVSENPNQHLHIKEPHGFNIGGARQPAGCLNSQHSHLTAEVFIVHKSKWRFKFGVNADEGFIDLEVGDTISIPIHMFRGFENIGNEVGFMFAVLGQDNPGKVTWSPKVFKLAQKYGLVLLKGGRLIDKNIGEKIPSNAKIEKPPTPKEISKLKTPSPEKMHKCVAIYNDLTANPSSALTRTGVEEAGIIITKKTGDGFETGAIKPWWEHGFNLRKLKINPQKKTKWYARREAEVIFIQEGELTFCWKKNDQEESLVLNKGDTLTVPKKLLHCWDNRGEKENNNFLVIGTDSPTQPKFM